MPIRVFDRVPASEPGDDTPLTRIHVLVVAVCALGFTFDLGEIAFGTALSGVFSAPPYALAPAALGWLLAANYLGAIIGTPLFGSLADRSGRRIALSATLLLLALASFAAAASPSVLALTLARGVAGFALGAYPPLMITYLTDILPARHRGSLILVTAGIAYLGPLATIFTMRAIGQNAPLGFAGWRWVIAAGGLGSAIGGLLFFALPESGRWRRAAEHGGRSLLSNLSVVLSRPHFALVAGLSFLSPWATVAFPLLTGAILVQRGYSLSDTLLYVGISAFGPIIGTILAAALADRVERRTSLIACSFGMAASAIGFWSSTGPISVSVSSLAFNLCVALYLPAINVYVAELFPTVARARATSLAWAANRIAAALGPLCLLPLLRAFGVVSVLACILGTLASGVALLGVFGPPGRAGRTVD